MYFFYDYKSELNQLCDHESLDLTYDLVHEEGEPHNKTFTMAAIINGENYGTGSGGSKKKKQSRMQPRWLLLILIFKKGYA